MSHSVRRGVEFVLSDDELSDETTETETATDLSASSPIVKWSEEWWANAKPETQARRCTAHRKNGDRCKHLALNFQRVCAFHGGKAKQSVQAARRRMMENADPAVKQLAKIAFDDTAPIETRLKATIAIIDRTGLAPRTSIDLEVNPKPFEAIFEEMEMGGSRAAFRGEPEVLEAIDDTQSALVEAIEDDDGPLDVEVIEPEPITPEDSLRGLDDDSGPESPFASTPPPEAALMSLDAAVSAAAQMRRHAVQRAITQGK
jgi:hypothetical protein